MTRYIRAYLRAFRQTAQFEPLLIPVAVLLALCMGVKPFINIYFSARIVAELSGAQAVRTLVTLVAVCLGLNFLLQLLTDFLTPTFYMLRSRLYEKERMTVEHKLFRLDFGMTSVLGLISLVGIIVRNGIIMYEYAEELRFQKGYDVRSAAEEAGKRRMRPIFLTSCTTALGVLPMIISGDALWMPMGVVICFGTMLSIFLIVLMMPVSYWQIFKNSKVKVVQDEKD